MKNQDKVTDNKIHSPLKDILVVIICIIGSLVCTYFFYMDINATLTRLDEQPVGTITFRYNIAQRRFMNRLVWDRLRSDTPVYNGDVIRTDKLSEVVIAFDHGEVVNLYSNTLVQIFVDEEGSKIDFSGGTIVVNTPKEGEARQPVRRTTGRTTRQTAEQAPVQIPETAVRKPLVINSGDRQITIESGSTTRISAAEDESHPQEVRFDLSVSEGTVIMQTSGTTETFTIEAGNNLLVTREGAVTAPLEETIIPERETSYSVIEADFRSPFVPIRDLLMESAQIMENAQRTESVQTIMETIQIIENAQSENRETETAAAQVTVQQQTASPVTAAPPVTQRQVTQRPAAPPAAPAAAAQRPLLPVPGNRVPASPYTITPQMILESGSLDFSWNSVQGANGYILTIFRETGDSRSTVIETPVLRETGYSLENLRTLARGNFYWQVEAVNVLSNGNFDRRGQLQENRIIVDIPIQQINTRETGVLYGN